MAKYIRILQDYAIKISSNFLIQQGISAKNNRIIISKNKQEIQKRCYTVDV